MEIAAAQQDMSRAYVRGAPGVFVSGVVWLIAGALWQTRDLATGFAALFVGGILIFPVSTLLCRLAFRAPKASLGNPLERLALESTFMLFAGIFLAWCFLQAAPELTFPAMAVAIGVRYFVFRTVYGSAIYWVLGGCLAAAGVVAALDVIALPVNVALLVGAIEIVLSVAVFMFGKHHTA
jgi:hypothetical protein